MLSLETAQKLKEAGLKWEFEYGFPKDTAYYKGKLHDIEGPGASETYRLAPWGTYVKQKNMVFAPRLDQLLTEITKNAWGYRLSALWADDILVGYECLLVKRDEYELDKWRDLNKSFRVYGDSASPEEPTAQALLWILEQEGRA